MLFKTFIYPKRIAWINVGLWCLFFVDYCYGIVIGFIICTVKPSPKCPFPRLPTKGFSSISKSILFMYTPLVGTAIFSILIAKKLKESHEYRKKYLTEIQKKHLKETGQTKREKRFIFKMIVANVVYLNCMGLHSLNDSFHHIFKGFISGENCQRP